MSYLLLDEVTGHEWRSTSLGGYLILDALVVLDVLAEVNSWTPYVALIVQTTAGLLCVFMPGDSHLVPGRGEIKSSHMDAKQSLVSQDFL